MPQERKDQTTRTTTCTMDAQSRTCVLLGKVHHTSPDAFLWRPVLDVIRSIDVIRRPLPLDTCTTCARGLLALCLGGRGGGQVSIHVFAYGLWIFARYHVGKHLFDRSYASIRELLVALETLRDCSCSMPCRSMISLRSCRKNDGSKPLTCALQTFLLDRSRCCLQSLQNRPAAEHGEGFARSQREENRQPRRL